MVEADNPWRADRVEIDAEIAHDALDAPPNFYVPNKSPGLTTTNGSSPGDITSKFLKVCWVLLRGMVTWGKL
ncbi:MAG: hypothetical protein Q8M18_18385 [Bradyrhizobium sp.]|nr:hypothetical protein [Bradyrhizobium sp.]